MTVLLPPSVGGLDNGMLNRASETADDVADTAERVRVWNDDEEYNAKTEGMHRVLTVACPAEDEDAEERTWDWFAVPNGGEPSAHRPVEWDVHVGDVERVAGEIVQRLPLSEDLRLAVKLAAKYHDHGKKREQFQRVLGNTNYPER